MPDPYIIQSGDTLGALAAKNGTDVATLAKLNNIADPNKIQAGASLNFPDAPVPVPKPSLTDTLTSSSGVATSDPIRAADAKAAADKAAADKAAADELARTQTQAEITRLKTTYGLDKPAPTAPSLVDTYNTLRTKYGAADLETKIAGLTQQETDLRDQFKKFSDSQQGLGRTEGFVQGTISEAGKKIQDQLDAVTREKAIAVNELTAKTNTISTLMSLTKEDYANTKASYEKDFSDAIQIMNAMKANGTAADKAADNARANLQILVNKLSTGDLTASSITPEQRANISQLELQAGLPVGVTLAIKDANPKADIFTSSTRTENGVKYLDVVTKDKTTGAFSTTSVQLGKDSGGAEGGAQVFDSVKLEAAQIFSADQKKNGDHKVGPELYGSMRAKVPAQFRDDFDRAFQDRLSEETKQQFGITAKASLDSILNNYLNLGANASSS